jgi:hypothetical protein
MALEARYALSNLIARDSQQMARFYTEVFRYEPLGPERDQGGRWLDQATGLQGAPLTRHAPEAARARRRTPVEIFT